MAGTLRLEIVTPEGIAFSDDVTMVTLPGIEGQLGIYPQHVSLITEIVPGEVIAHHGSSERLLAVGSGLVDISAARVAIVTDMAVAAEHIDEAKVDAARRRAEARLREVTSDEEIAAVQASLARSLAQLHVRRRHRASRPSPAGTGS
jgi:F-type H+-transporting ATPase subunit epsilon